MLKEKQKGITLVALIITIIIMLILAGVTINIGTESLEQSKVIKFVMYMQAIQEKVDTIYENGDYLNYGEDLNSEQKQTIQNIAISEGLLTTNDSEYLKFFDSNKISSELNLENINDEIIVDFNTREVISLTGVENENKVYYTQYNIPGGQKLQQKTQELARALSFDGVEARIEGLNAIFAIKNLGITNGTLSYGKSDSDGNIKWTVITNYTIKEKDFVTKNITESGTYCFKLEDNVSGKDNSDEEGNYPSYILRLTNSPKLEENLTDLSLSYNYSDINDSTKWAYATDTTDESNLVYYVWIPRYAYKLDSTGALEELQFLRGNSDITTSGGYINSTDWTLPDAFVDETNNKIGVWVQVDTPNKSRCRYN